MKRQIITQIQAAVALMLLITACGDDATDTWQDAGNGSPLTIQVCSDDFTSSDGSLTRAADMRYTTVFQDGDRLGIVAEQQDGSKQNLCATYNGATKAWEGIYYDSKTTYVSAYFPYHAELTDKLGSISDASGVLSALKTLMPPSSDQSSLAAYRASDLLTGTCTLHAEGGKSLSVALNHAYSLLLLRAGTEYTTSDGSTYRLPLRDVQVSVDDALACTPFASAEGYRLIVDKSGSSSVAWFYTLLDGKTYKVAGSAFLTEGAYHLYKNVISGGSRDFTVGDFYYSDGSIIPKDTETPPTEGCIGIVCWVGDDAFNEDPLLKNDHPGCTHGLVVALQDAGSMHWSDSYEYVQNWVKEENGNPYKDVVNLQAEDKRCGYSNTLALKDYNAGKYSSNVNSNNGYRVLPIDAVEQYAVENPAPANSSGWYFPSVMELKYVCWGQDNDQSASGKDNLNPYISQVGGTVFGLDFYWSSTEASDYRASARGVYFGDGYVGYSSKSLNAYRVRPLLAF